MDDIPRHRLFELPSPEARRLLAGGAPAWLRVNPKEYHGPHLDVWNDALVSEGFVGRLVAKLRGQNPGWDWLDAGELGVGSGTVKGPGTENTPPATVRRQVLEACDRLADLGAKKVVLMTFHGDPLHNHAIWAGVTRLRKRGIQAVAPMNLVLHAQMDPAASDLDDVLATVQDAEERRVARQRIAEELHAGFLETSVAMCLAPDTVRDPAKVPSCSVIVPVSVFRHASTLAKFFRNPPLAIELNFLALALGWFAIRPFPGYSGMPHLANSRAGELLVKRIATQMHDHIKAVFDSNELPMPPPLLWLETLTWRGRLDVGR